MHLLYSRTVPSASAARPRRVIVGRGGGGRQPSNQPLAIIRHPRDVPIVVRDAYTHLLARVAERPADQFLLPPHHCAVVLAAAAPIDAHPVVHREIRG